jgi:hypothetical protein
LAQRPTPISLPAPTAAEPESGGDANFQQPYRLLRPHPHPPNPSYQFENAPEQNLTVATPEEHQRFQDEEHQRIFNEVQIEAESESREHSRLLEVIVRSRREEEEERMEMMPPTLERPFETVRAVPVTMKWIVAEALEKKILLCPDRIPKLNPNVTSFHIEAMQCMGTVCGKWLGCSFNPNIGYERRTQFTTVESDLELDKLAAAPPDNIRRIEMPRHDTEAQEGRSADRVYIDQLTDADCGRWVFFTGTNTGRRDRGITALERGRIKSWGSHAVWVVYSCLGDWENFASYTAQATNPAELRWSP